MNRHYATFLIVCLLGCAGGGAERMAVANEGMSRSEAKQTDMANKGIPVSPGGELTMRSDGSVKSGINAFVLRYQFKEEGKDPGNREVSVWWISPAGQKTSVPLRWVDGPVWAARVELKAEPGRHRLVALVVQPTAGGAGPAVAAVSEQTYRLELPQGNLYREENQIFTPGAVKTEAGRFATEGQSAATGQNELKIPADAATTMGQTMTRGAAAATNAWRSATGQPDFSAYVVFFLIVLFNFALLLAGVIILGIYRRLPPPVKAWLTGRRRGKDILALRERLTQAGLLDAQSGRAVPFSTDLKRAATLALSPRPSGGDLPSTIIDQGIDPPSPVDKTSMGGKRAGNELAWVADISPAADESDEKKPAPANLPQVMALEEPDPPAVAEHDPTINQLLSREQSEAVANPTSADSVSMNSPSTEPAPISQASSAETPVADSRADEQDSDNLLLSPELMAMLQGDETRATAAPAVAPPKDEEDPDNLLLSPELLAMLHGDESQSEETPAVVPEVKEPEEAPVAQSDEAEIQAPAAADNLLAPGNLEGLSSDELTTSLERLMTQLQTQEQPAAQMAKTGENGVKETEVEPDPAAAEEESDIDLWMKKLLETGQALGDDGLEEPDANEFKN